MRAQLHETGYLELPNQLSRHGRGRFVLPLAVGAALGSRLRRTKRRRRSDVATELGRGLVAGFAGTVGITAAGALEQWWKEHAKAGTATERRQPSGLAQWIVKVHEPWLFAADGAAKVLGLESVGESGRVRLGIAAHWMYGLGWGVALGLLRAAGVRGALFAGATLAGQLAAEFVAMPKAKFFPPPREWGRDAILASVRDHAAFALAAATTFAGLEHA